MEPDVFHFNNYWLGFDTIPPLETDVVVFNLLGFFYVI